MLTTVVFGIFYSSLTLMLCNRFSLSKESSVYLASLFLGLHFSLPMIGGLALRWFRAEYLFFVGKLFQVAGIITMITAELNSEIFIIGMSLFLIDSTFSSVTINCMVNEMCKNNEHNEKGKAFLSAHVWTNIGFILSYLISGILFSRADILGLLYISSSISLMYLIYSFYIFKISFSFSRKSVFLFSILSLSSFSLFKILNCFSFARSGIIICSLILFSGLSIISCVSSSARERVEYYKALFFMLLTVVFWSIYMLGPTLIPILIAEQQLVSGISVPPQIIQAISPILVVLIGRCLAKKRGYLSHKHNFSIGLIAALTSLSLLLAISHFGAFGILNIFIAILFLAVGETFLSPSSFCLAGSLSNAKWRSVYLAAMQLSLGVGVVMSAEIPKIIAT